MKKFLELKILITSAETDAGKFYEQIRRSKVA